MGNLDLLDLEKLKPKKVKLINGYEKIAAGEVIERPASVVKELVENSIDAGSTLITIVIKNYGKELIQVIDNGSGINLDDIELSFQAHTSSKIDSAEDLNNLSTLGFRGEALYSISSISKIELTTKTETDEMGIKCAIKNKQKIKSEFIGTARGTNIKVKDIFYNTPVRYKFLKTDRVEMGHITDIITRMVLCYSKIQFILIHNDVPLINSPATKNHINKIFDIYGKKIVKNVVNFSFDDSDYKIHGFLGTPSLSRSTTITSSVFVNNRYVKSPVVHNAMKEAYKDYIMVNKHPFYVVFLEIDPSRVDFNIHPTKQIIRFQNEEELQILLTRSLLKIIKAEFGGKNNESSNNELSNNKPPNNENSNYEYLNISLVKKEMVQSNINIPKADTNNLNIRSMSEDKTIFDKKNNNEKNNENSNENKTDNNINKNITSHYDIPLDVLYDIKDDRNNKETKSERNIETINTNEKINTKDHVKNWIDTSGIFPKVRVPNQACQLNNLYFILEGVNSFYILDMHAAHERINYEDQLDKFSKGGIKKQKLLLPLNFDVPVNERDFILDSIKKLDKYGFEISHMGSNTFAIRTFPANFSDRTKVKFDPDFVINIVQEIVTMGRGTKTSLDSEFDKIIKYIACHMSLRGGERINNPDIVKKLLKRLAKCKNPNHCAHGRPVMLEFTYSQIDKMFHR